MYEVLRHTHTYPLKVRCAGRQTEFRFTPERTEETLNSGLPCWPSSAKGSLSTGRRIDISSVRTATADMRCRRTLVRVIV